jgi:hypothetical protein
LAVLEAQVQSGLQAQALTTLAVVVAVAVRSRKAEAMPVAQVEPVAAVLVAHLETMVQSLTAQRERLTPEVVAVVVVVQIVVFRLLMVVTVVKVLSSFAMQTLIQQLAQRLALPPTRFREGTAPTHSPATAQLHSEVGYGLFRETGSKQCRD